MGVRKFHGFAGFAIFVAAASGCASVTVDHEPAISNLVQGLYSSEAFRGARFAGSACSSFEFADQLSGQLRDILCPYLDIQLRLAKVRTTDEKLIREGPVFVGNYEGVTGYDVAAIRIDGPTAEVEMNLTYSGPEGKGDWKDRLILFRERGEWQLDDVVWQIYPESPVSLRETIVGDEQTKKNARTYLVAK